MWHDKKSGCVAVEDTETGKVTWRHPPDANEMVRQKDKRYKYANPPRDSAKPVKGTVPEVEADDDDAKVNTHDFNKFNKQQLRAMAVKAGIDEDTGKWSKAELVEALGQTDFVPTPAADDDGEDDDDGEGEGE